MRAAGGGCSGKERWPWWVCGVVVEEERALEESVVASRGRLAGFYADGVGSELSRRLVGRCCCWHMGSQFVWERWRRRCRRGVGEGRGNGRGAGI